MNSQEDTYKSSLQQEENQMTLEEQEIKDKAVKIIDDMINKYENRYLRSMNGSKKEKKSLRNSDLLRKVQNKLLLIN